MNEKIKKISEKFETIPASLITFYLVVIFLLIIVLDLSQQGSFNGLDKEKINKEVLEKESSENVDVEDEFRQEFEIGKEKRGITGRAIGWIEGEGKWWLSGVIGIIGIILIISFIIKKWGENEINNTILRN